MDENQRTLAVEAVGLRKGFGDRLLIDGLDFKLPKGGIVGAILVQEGEAVKAGDVVLRLDDTQTRAGLTKAFPSA